MKFLPGRLITLKTENYILRTLTRDHLTDRMVSWFSDPEVMKFVDLPLGMEREQVSDFLSQFDGRARFVVGIFDRETKLCIGFFQIYCNMNVKNARTAVVIGEKGYWGKGVVLETRPAILDFLFDRLSLHKVFGTVFSRNLPAIFNYKAQGFRSEGVLREEYPTRDGGWHDICRFGMLSHEWRTLKGKADE